jgi:allantoate deiminase
MTMDGLKPLAAAALERCDRLARLSEHPLPRLTRTFLSPPMREVHRLLREWMTAAGMSVRVDGIGNVIGRYEGAVPGAPALLIGSHLDTVPDAGRFDGVLGVMLGIAAVEAMAGRRLPFAIEVVGFSEEEGARFGTPYLGSLGFVGRLSPELLALRDANGASVEHAARSFGVDPSSLRFDASRYVAYLEAHVEQGPVLESRGAPLGVVSAIVGQSRRRVRFVGRAGHAGTTPMNLRRDALAAAAEWVVRGVEGCAGWRGGVATVGRMTPSSGASNVIVGEVAASVDVRHEADETRERMVTEILDAGQTIAARRDVVFEVADAAAASDHRTVAMDARLVGRLRAAAGGDDVPLLASGAGHDAAILAPLIPACLLFVRSPGGVSHHPDEHVYAADVERALAAMVRFVESLASDPLV